VELFSRPGCHLCDEVLELIGQLSHSYPLRVSVINVEGQPELDKSYGERLPVVRVTGLRDESKGRLFEYPLKPAALEAEFQQLWKQSMS
jgi:thiol-disulfide isomerase/thioredoxin